MKTVYIIGSSGQDGRLLTKLLFDRDCEYKTILFSGTKLSVYFRNQISYEVMYSTATFCSVFSELTNVHPPGTLFFFAARHYSSTEILAGAANAADELYVNQELPTLILQHLAQHNPSSHFIYTSSSLIFAGSDESPQTENTTRAPLCSYAVSKAKIEKLCNTLDRKGKLKTTVLIAYNHESVYRHRRFFTSKVISYALEHSLRIRSNVHGDKLYLNNPDSSIDMGYASEFVSAMALIMDREATGSFILSTGRLITIREFTERVFHNYEIPLDFAEYKTSDKRYISVLRGDNSKIAKQIGWSPSLKGIDIVDKLCHDYSKTIA